MHPASFRPAASSRGLWTNYYLNGHTALVGTPVTIDARTLTTNYNVLDNHSGAKELWLRRGFQWDITNNISLKSQAYGYEARHASWFNNEINSFQTIPVPNNVYRERLCARPCPKTLRQRHRPDDQLEHRRDGKQVRHDRCGEQAADWTTRRIRCSFQTRSIWSIRTAASTDRAAMRRSIPISTRLSLSFEDRLKVTSTFALIGGIRFEDIELSGTRFSPTVYGWTRGYPFSTTSMP